MSQTSSMTYRTLTINTCVVLSLDPCSGISAGPRPDTSSVSTSAQVLAFVDAIKQQYGLKHVFAWHACMGYWSGVSPEAAAVDAASAMATAQGDAAAAAAAAAEVVLPRVSPVMSDLEPPTNWSQLVRGLRAPCA
jgi:hypothetical protein